ncbi:Os02g0125200, partial [Oryza sativa Japonica Group]
ELLSWSPRRRPRRLRRLRLPLRSRRRRRRRRRSRRRRRWQWRRRRRQPISRQRRWFQSPWQVRRRGEGTGRGRGGGRGSTGRYTPAAAVGAVMKRGRGRPVGFVSRASPVSVAVTAATSTAAVVVSSPATHTQTPLGPLGELVACASGANFTPHIINVAAGEDVNMKVISFSQQGPRAICILSANGVISNVTLRQQDTLGGTVTYEGRFELLSLSGSFTPTDSGGTRSRSGGMSVSLAATDGRVIGGGVAGLLVAASPVQVVVGSFLPSYQLDQNATKKPVIEITTVPPPPPAIGFTISSGDPMEDSYSGSHGQHRSGAAAATTTTAKANSTSAFRVENWTPPAPPAAEAARTKTPSSEAKVPVPGA